MKAIVTDGGFGTRFEDVPDPLPRYDEILVEVQATSINRADLLIAPLGSAPSSTARSVPSARG